MTDIEKKALALVNEARNLCRTSILSDKMARDLANELERAIEQHEAYKQEVSDAVVKLGCWPDTVDLGRFIIAKPDPLVEVFDATWPGIDKAMVEALRAAIEKRGGKIVWGEG